MAVRTSPRPGFLERAQRTVERLAGVGGQRVLSLNDAGDLEHHGVDLLGQLFEGEDGAKGRRLNRSNNQVVNSFAAVFAAVRWREQAITRPRIVLQQKIGGDWSDVGDVNEPNGHPALAVLSRPNAGLPFKKAWGGVERGKLTNGDHYWVKRRDGLKIGGRGVVREFEVWSGSSARAVARKDRPWEPAYFAKRNPDGSTTEVGPEDVVWFRHIVHPEDPMLSLTPIGAIRTQADTNLEGQRYTQRYFDRGIGAGAILVPDLPEGGSIGAGEIARMRQTIEAEWAGADNAHRWHLMDQAFKVLMTPQTNVDLQFVEMNKWGVTEVARAFEVSPITIKDFEHATYSNADQAAAQDWDTIRNQIEATIEELNEFFIRPDFGDDFRLVPRFEGISALQDDAKKAAEVDEIHLRTGRRIINEIRERDGEDPVEWGDLPLLPLNVAPLGTIPSIQTPGQLQTAATGDAAPASDPVAPAPAPASAPASPTRRLEAPARAEDTPATSDSSALRDAEDAMRAGWEGRLRRELRSFLAYLDATSGGELAAGPRSFDPGDVEGYDWDWAERHGAAVRAEIARSLEISLLEAGFVETPLLSAHTLAESWARARAAELLNLGGSVSAVRATQDRVKVLVARALENGDSLRTLKNAIRESDAFGPVRAETIARTETATAIGHGTRQAARSQGRDLKRWRTARDERVDAPSHSGPCVDNEAAGWISIDDAFPAGQETIPAHPRCRCDVEYRTGRLRP